MYGYNDHDEKDCIGEPCPLHGNPVPYFARVLFVLFFLLGIVYFFRKS